METKMIKKCKSWNILFINWYGIHKFKFSLSSEIVSYSNGFDNDIRLFVGWYEIRLILEF